MRLKSFLQYFGSKSRLTQKLSHLLPPMKDITTVISPFFGSGSFEYYLIENNPHITLYGYDIEKELVNYHNCLIENPQKLHNEIVSRFQYPLDKKTFLFYRNILTTTYVREDNKYYLASILFGLSRNSYSGKLRSFAKKPTIVSVKYMKNYLFNSTNLQGKIHINYKNCFDVLKDKNIQNNPHIFIYLDPPYHLDEKPNINHYGIISLQASFDHQRLYNVLKNIKTKWMLSYNYSNYILNLYKDYNICNENVVYLRYTTTKTHSDKFKELMVTNY